MIKPHNATVRFERGSSEVETRVEKYALGCILDSHLDKLDGRSKRTGILETAI